MASIRFQSSDTTETPVRPSPPPASDRRLCHATSPASGNNTYSSAPLDTITNANISTVSGSDQTYTLDALGDWSSSTTAAGTGTSTAPTPSSTDRTNNSQNEQTAVGGTNYYFDNNGNTLGLPSGGITYDAWNRPATAASDGYGFTYLPNSDQASQSCVGSSVAINSYYTTDMQALQDEKLTTSGDTTTTVVQDQYVWGLGYVNQMVERDDNSSSGSLGKSGSGLGVRIYPEQDANWNVRTLTGSDGTVLEHIDYDSYGNGTVLSSSYSPVLLAGSPIGVGNDPYSWVYGFQGGRFDPRTGLYRFGDRDYSPALDRWMEQDGGCWDGSNLYQSFDSAPEGNVDPAGAAAIPSSFDLYNLLGSCGNAVKQNQAAIESDEASFEGAPLPAQEITFLPMLGEYAWNIGWSLGTPVTDWDQTDQKLAADYAHTSATTGQMDAAERLRRLSEGSAALQQAANRAAAYRQANAGYYAAEAAAAAQAKLMAAYPSDTSSSGGGTDFDCPTEYSSSPALPGDPYSPRNVDLRRSAWRRYLNTGNEDPNSPIPDRGPRRNVKGTHSSGDDMGHTGGERNVNPSEEHSRVPKGSGGGQGTH